MGAYTELVDFTFTAAETSRTFSGLSITKNDFIKVVVTFFRPTGANSSPSLFPDSATTVSGHDTQTNYHNQQILADGSSVSATRTNINRIAQIDNGQTSLTVAYIKLSENNRFNMFANFTGRTDNNIYNFFSYTTSSGVTFPNGIDSLELKNHSTNGIGTGSRIQIYRLDAEKVADITVTSNTTQVDISNLSIDKDSEYLLVSDWFSDTTNNIQLRLTPNDATTLTAYHKQSIFGNGSSAGAGRANDPTIANTIQPRMILHTHIKLSNIGAYTSQTYGLHGTGSTSLILSNDFVSSTAENITSITKLNLFTSATDRIRAGSRFTLYKLYE